MRTVRHALVLAALWLSNHACAQQVLSYYSQLPQASADWKKTLELPAFDPSLGTLTQVKLTFAGEVWQTLYAENLSDLCTRYNLSTAETLTLGKLGGGELFSTRPVTLHRIGKLGDFDGVVDFSDSSGVRFSQYFSVSGVYVDPDLAEYLGSTPVRFSVAARALSTLASGGNFVGGASNLSAAGLGVEYTFVPIPEPAASAALLGMVVIAAVAVRRRKQVAAVR